MNYWEQTEAALAAEREATGIENRKFDAMLVIRLPGETKQKIEHRAHLKKCSVSTWCRRVLEKTLKELESQAPDQSKSQ